MTTEDCIKSAKNTCKLMNKKLKIGLMKTQHLFALIYNCKKWDILTKVIDELDDEMKIEFLDENKRIRNNISKLSYKECLEYFRINEKGELQYYVLKKEKES